MHALGVQHLSDLVNSVQHDAIGWSCSCQAGGKASVKPFWPALCHQFLHTNLKVEGKCKATWCLPAFTKSLSSLCHACTPAVRKLLRTSMCRPPWSCYAKQYHANAALLAMCIKENRHSVISTCRPYSRQRTQRPGLKAYNSHKGGIRQKYTVTDASSSCCTLYVVIISGYFLLLGSKASVAMADLITSTG